MGWDYLLAAKERNTNEDDAGNEAEETTKMGLEGVGS